MEHSRNYHVLYYVVCLLSDERIRVTVLLNSVSFLKYENECLWVIGPFSLVETGRRFRGAYCLHHYELTALMIEAESTPFLRLHSATSQKTFTFSLL
jgi:hypothetical protein